MKILRALLFAVGALIANPVLAKDRDDIDRSLGPWVGFWKVSFNEDPIPADTFELTADGLYLGQGINCSSAFVGKAHIYDDEIYIRFDLPGKGPLALILKPNAKADLVYTSPRTRNNAVYSRLPSSPCAAKGG